MTVPHDNIRWRKSTRSQDQGDCVELGLTEVGNAGLVRDSKNTAGPTLTVDLRSLLAAVKCGLVDG